jgi:hypothetical protein
MKSHLHSRPHYHHGLHVLRLQAQNRCLLRFSRCLGIAGDVASGGEIGPGDGLSVATAAAGPDYNDWSAPLPDPASGIGQLGLVSDHHTIGTSDNVVSGTAGWRSRNGVTIDNYIFCPADRRTDQNNQAHNEVQTKAYFQGVSFPRIEMLKSCTYSKNRADNGDVFVGSR